MSSTEGIQEVENLTQG